MRFFFIPIVLLVCVYSGSFAQGKLIFAIDVARHGDRTPLTISPEMEKIWPQGMGQLTPNGMRQAFMLGKALRERYVDEYHLLPKHYDTNAMIVRSSSLARTMMSAQSILFGLYPLGTGPSLSDGTNALPEGLQPIPIHTVLPEQDSLLLPHHDREKYNRLLESYILNSPEWLQKDKVLKPNYPAWSRLFGIQISNLFDLIHVGDRLLIENLYNIPPPDGLQEKDADLIVAAGKWAFLHIINHPKLSLAVGSELAEKIKHELNLAAEQNRPLKYLLFVAHDTNLAAQLKILGQVVDDIPPYASTISYLLFDMGGSNYEVRVVYNQKPLFIPECGSTSCTLNDFIHLIDDQLHHGDN